MLKELQNSLTGCHFGVIKSLQKIRQRIYWSKATEDVKKWCQSWDVYAAKKGSKTRIHGKLHRCDERASFGRIALVILSPLTKTCRDNKYTFAVMYFFMKWSKAYPILERNIYNSGGVIAKVSFEIWHTHTDSLRPRNEFHLLYILRIISTSQHRQNSNYAYAFIIKQHSREV